LEEVDVFVVVGDESFELGEEEDRGRLVTERADGSSVDHQMEEVGEMKNRWVRGRRVGEGEADGGGTDQLDGLEIAGSLEKREEGGVVVELEILQTDTSEGGDVERKGRRTDVDRARRLPQTMLVVEIKILKDEGISILPHPPDLFQARDSLHRPP